MALRYYLMDVFTDRMFGGNPLAVVPEAPSLSTETMQSIARELNLSETVFVFSPERGGLKKIRIFTPRSELPFAGHPTVGTAILLAELGLAPQPEGECRIVLEEGVGPVPVALRMRQGRPEFAQLTAAQLPEFRAPSLARETISAMLSLETADLHPGPLEPIAASCGVPFFFVPLRDRAAVGRASLDRTVWQKELAGQWAEHVLVYALEGELPGSDLRGRMFAPAAGIAEDPATGGAAVALAGYLARQRSETSGTFRWTLEQGFEMGRPSLLYLEAEKRAGEIIAVRVGGQAVVIGEGTLRIE
ncbi:MAG TPA: PhzF family phenazine biosynthesis protein [Candidatus Polarisedimenticolia bacterium]|nr:PhzF family phenazine biosynthesis protein [Candidatus Polarisedimenticolia bacterium]